MKIIIRITEIDFGQLKMKQDKVQEGNGQTDKGAQLF